SGFSTYYTKNVLLQSTMINGYNLQGGILYRRPVISDKIQLNVGLTGGFSGIFNANTSNYLQKRIISNGSDGVYLRDTLSGNSSKINLPSSFTIGTSLNKGEEWTLGTDFTFQNFSGLTFRSNNSIQNAFNWSLGGEFNPIFKREKSYFTRIVYRAGVYAGRTQFNINGNSINDMGFTVGFGAPLGKLFSYINVSAQIGTRGTTDGGLIKEDYFKFNLGLNVNDRWFIRPKVD
ncbi:MAG: hypothetical protein K2Q22_01660, partial [Cytophagales bacterium]|nr:hypothetical protein [Cytophagales bacterium]